MKPVTVILTSCNRFDLLNLTIASFLHLNTYPIHAFYVHNDGKWNDEILSAMKALYPSITWLHSEERRGLSGSLDFLLSKVKTDYVFTGEDDWSYYKAPGFIEKSMNILEEHNYINQVWIRDTNDHKHPLGPVITVSRHRVQNVQYGYQKHWNGWSLNPGLRRMSDLKKFFPNGLSEYGDEIEMAKRTAKFNYKAVSLVEGSIKHIGWKRHTKDFKV